MCHSFQTAQSILPRYYTALQVSNQVPKYLRLWESRYLIPKSLTSAPT